MIELLQHYSLSDILIFTILLALSIKSLISFFDWGYDYIKKIFNIKYSKINQKQALERRLQQEKQAIDELKQNQQETDKILKDLSAKINILISSDRDAIKSYITDKHHYYCYKIGYIDDFSLDCIEKRFKHYSDEGGNSFIENFMKELRALPIQSPKKE